MPNPDTTPDAGRERVELGSAKYDLGRKLEAIVTLASKWEDAAEKFAAVLRDTALAPPEPAAPLSQGAPDTQALAEAFCVWPLPQSVCSDRCATDPNYGFPRSGTNLLTVDEAKAMFDHLVDCGLLRTAPPSQAAADVLAERRRQVEVEGWTPEHDDRHDKGEMARAAASYVAASSIAFWMGVIDCDHDIDPPLNGLGYSAGWHHGIRNALNWPWDRKRWKPGLVRRNLVKAGALILAEIERIDRATRKDRAHDQ